MTALHGRKTTVLLDAVNLSPYLVSLSLGATASAPDTSTFGNDWTTAIGGKLSAECSVEGLYDPALVVVNEALTTEGRVLSVCHGSGATVGDVARLVSLDTTAYAESDDDDAAVAFSWAGLAITAVAAGIMAHPLAEDVNTTTGAAIDLGASASTGWTGHAHVTAVDAGSWVITVQDSADGTSGWATIATFAAKTAAGAERLLSAAATTTVRRYIRVVATRTGGTAGDGITYALAFARARES